MTSPLIDRRDFLHNTGIAMCGLCFSGLPSLAGADEEVKAQEPLDPTKLNYCGYNCPADCKFLKATLENDIELKREAFKIWEIEKRFGTEFDPETAICHGCKTKDKPEGVVVKGCDVRACAQEKKIDCCIECEELAACEKTLWTRFPKFKEQVVEAQKRYRAQENK